jgi:hypothetical protein
MSVSFEKRTKEVVESATEAVTAAKDGPLPGTSGKHPISAAIGTALTGGKEMAGTKGYLAVRHDDSFSFTAVVTAAEVLTWRRDTGLY